MTNIQKINEAKAILKGAQREIAKAIELLPQNELDIRRRASIAWLKLEEIIGGK